jgi:hypothetical protein
MDRMGVPSNFRRLSLSGSFGYNCRSPGRISHIFPDLHLPTLESIRVYSAAPTELIVRMCTVEAWDILDSIACFPKISCHFCICPDL